MNTNPALKELIWIELNSLRNYGSTSQIVDLYLIKNPAASSGVF
jgi:hypothetical protein